MSELNRRQVVAATAGIVALAQLGKNQAQAQPTLEAPDQDDRLFVEPQRGDPAVVEETLSFNPIAIQRAVLGRTQADFEPRIENIRSEMVNEAIRYLGKNRTNNRDEIGKWFDLFNLPFALNGNPLPFCATGLSYVAATLYARQKGVTSFTTSSLRNFLGDVDHHHFYPSPSVMDIKMVAMGKRRWIARSSATGALAPRPGWLVVYDWNGDGRSDHIGLVERLVGTTLHTIEFNTSAINATNGGSVARKTRPLNSRVQGFVRPELVRLV